MKVAPLGKKHSTGELMFDPIEKVDFAKMVQENYEKNKERSKGLDTTQQTFDVVRGVVEHKLGTDIGDPRQAGWTYLISEDEPLFNEIMQTIRPLADHRGMVDPEKPLIFRGESLDQWSDWMFKNLARDRITFKPAPHYVFIIGDPNLIPFKFQSILSTCLCVGRLDIDDNIDNLKTYVEKVKRIETSQQPFVTNDTIFFATDEGIRKTGCSDPTFYSHHYMSKPLSKYVQTQINFKTNEIMAEKATKQNLLGSVGKSKPCLVFTASHGMSTVGESSDIQKKYTGAIACQNFSDSHDEQDSLITGDDIPLDTPFVEGGIFFQFGCFSYGAPSISDVIALQKSGDWGGMQIAQKSYVSSIPKKLLFNPHGPLAFIGHLDVALYNSFTDPKNLAPDNDYDPRIDPLMTSMQNLLSGDPVGRALVDVSKKYGIANAQFPILINSHNMKIISDDAFYPKLVDTYLDLADASNFMIFGDPAVSMKIQT